MSQLDLESISLSCPYCGEPIDLLLDSTAQEEVYIEDCTVCCRPIQVHIQSNLDGKMVVRLYHENEIVGT